MTTFNVNARMLAACAAFTLQGDPTRTYLSGVAIHRVDYAFPSRRDPGVYIMATNGHVMLACHDPSGAIDGAAVALFGAPKGFAAAVAKAHLNPRATFDGTTCAVLEHGTTAAAWVANPHAGTDAPRWVDGTVPDWPAVVADALTVAADSTVDRTVVAFDAALLEPFAAADRLLRGLRRNAATCIRVAVHPDRAWRVDFPAAPVEAFGLLMPMRNRATDRFPSDSMFHPVAERAA